MAAFAESTDIQSQINALLEQIKSLQQIVLQLSQKVTQTLPAPHITVEERAIGTSRWCAIARSLAQGAEGEDVSDFQAFLKDVGYLSVNPTGYFGPLTASAVAKWQSAEGLDAVGVLGPLSRERLMQKWCKGGIDKPIIEQRFKAEPQRGEAPLTVVFSTWLSGFRINTISYTIDYGDGSSERAADCYAPADACMAPGENKHTYTQNGTYTATLNKVTDPCAGQVACRAAVHSEVVGKLQIFVGTAPACTKEYRPVCGAKQVQCITTPCDPIPTTYGNECMMKADSATFLYEGACTDTTADPAKDPRCKAWYDGCNNCSRQSVDGPAMCTLRACITMSKPYCTAWFDNTNGNKPPVISSFSGPTSLKVGETGTWQVAASDPEHGTLTYNVSWGDEGWGLVPMMMSAGARDVFVQTTTFTHAYASAGVFTVGIVVRDSAGMSAKTSTTVRVGKDEPVACTMEYAPVCGRPQGCENTCPDGAYCLAMCKMPEPKTYGNKCQMRATGAEFLYEGECKTQPVACTADAKQCPDGSWVGRTGPNCEFVCPSLQTCANDSLCMCDSTGRTILCQ